MRCFNQSLLVGRLTADPEQRSFPSGKNVTTFSLAVKRDWYAVADRKEVPTDFFRVSVWGKFGEFVGKVLKKGMAILALGHFITRSFEGKNGPQSYQELLLTTMNILTWPKGMKPSSEAEQVVSLSEDAMADDAVDVTIEACNAA